MAAKVSEAAGVARAAATENAVNEVCNLCVDMAIQEGRESATRKALANLLLSTAALFVSLVDKGRNIVRW